MNIYMQICHNVQKRLRKVFPMGMTSPVQARETRRIP